MGAGNQYQLGERAGNFNPQGVARLYLAIVNRAIQDVLDEGEHSSAAERWLLSKDFDQLQELIG